MLGDLEKVLERCIKSVEEKTARIETLAEIMEHMMKINRIASNSVYSADMEEYYIEQINRWMERCEKEQKDAQEKERRSLEREKQYLMSLKKIRKLEKISTDTKAKYEYLKLSCAATKESQKAQNNQTS